MTLILRAAEAADELAAAIFGERIAKRLLDPLAPGDFVGLAQRLGVRLWKVARPVEERALAAALKATVGTDWTAEGGLGRKLDDLARKLDDATPEIADGIVAALGDAGPKLAAATRRSAAGSLEQRVAAGMSAADERTLEHLWTSQGHFVTNARGERVLFATARARDIVSQGLEGGLSNAEIGKALEAGLRDVLVGRSPAYYDTVASVFANRSRTFAALTVFEEAGVLRYRWQSVMDKRTSTQCRFMHGRVFTVRSALDRMRSVEQATDPDAVRSILRWPRLAKATDERPFDYEVGGGERSRVRSGAEALYYTDADGQRRLLARVDRDSNGDPRFANKASLAELEAAGICLPPLHGRCRSRIAPER